MMVMMMRIAAAIDESGYMLFVMIMRVDNCDDDDDDDDDDDKNDGVVNDCVLCKCIILFKLVSSEDKKTTSYIPLSA